MRVCVGVGVQCNNAEEDPREALLRYAQRAADKPQWVDVAYTETQPETVFTTKTLEEEQEAEKNRGQEDVDAM